MDIEFATSFAVLLPVLAVLALIDSLSFGTLAIPTWLLITPGNVRFPRILLYLATIGLFYFLVGLVLLLVARFASFQLSIDWHHPVLTVLGFVLGAGLLVLSFVLDPPGAAKKGQRLESQKSSGIYQRLAAWRAAAVDAPTPAAAHGVGTQHATQRPTLGLVHIALVAGALELATMLPYLAAIGLLTASATTMDLTAIHSVGLLAAYCVVMLLPAVVLVIGRATLERVATPILQRIDGWFAANGQSTVAWVFGILGVILLLNTWHGAAEFFTG